MELAESEALRLHDDHHRGIGHVDSHLNHGRCHEHLCLTACKALHLFVFLLGFHLAVYLAQSVFRKHLTQRGIAIFQAFQVDALALFDKWKDHIDLSSLLHLLAQSIVERWYSAVEGMGGDHGLASWRQFIDDADIEIAVECHSQGAGNGCGCHYEDMWRIVAFAP